MKNNYYKKINYRMIKKYVKNQWKLKQYSSMVGISMK